MSIPKPIVNLAILETLKSNDRKDEIDLFLPFAAISIARLEEVPFSAEQLQRQLLAEFGIDAPMSAVEVLIARARSRKLIFVENHAFFPDMISLKPWVDGFEGNVSEVNGSIKRVVGLFVDFAKEKYSKNLSEDDALDILYEYLQRNIGDSALISKGRLDFTGDDIKNRKHMTAAFIADLYSRKIDEWSDLEELVRAVMLASYLSYASQISGRQNYENITVYLDTPLILGLLGYSGEGRKKALLEMLEMLKSFKLSIMVFDITLREIEGILSAWAADLKARSYKKFNPKTLQMLHKNGIDSVSLETQISLLERKIEGLGIAIKRGFRLTDRYNCDVGALEEKIKKGFIGKYVDPRHDADALNRIYNTRKGGRVTSLDQGFSVFVTPNMALVNISQEFFGNSDRSIPCAVTDRWLTTMFWFKHPDIFKDLPTRMLVSSAYGTMFSENGFWKNFSDRLDTLRKNDSINEEDFVLVRYDSDLLLRVHELSVDKGMSFSDQDIFEVVKEIRAGIEAKAKASLEKSEAEKAILVEENFLLKRAEIRRIEVKCRSISVAVSVIVLSCVIFSIFYFFRSSVDYSGGSISLINISLTIAYVSGSIGSVLSAFSLERYLYNRLLRIFHYDELVASV